MSQNKTEKPTPKKKRDAAKQGQTFKSKDMVTTCLMLVGIEMIIGFVSLDDVKFIMQNIIEAQYTFSAQDYALLCLTTALKILLPVLVMSIVATVFPGIMQTGGQLALKALKLKFDSLNPIKGIKKIFNLRTLKELVKTIMYIVAFFVAAYIFWHKNSSLILGSVNSEAKYTFVILGELFHSLLIIFLGCIVLIVLFDAFCEVLLWLKELKMDKKEVEREHKESQGNPEIKSRRRQLHSEMLSEPMKQAVQNATAIVVNPTHIAVAIYINKDVTFIPYISLIEKNEKALAVKRYAKRVGTPIIEDVALARKLYATHRVNSFIHLACFTEVLDILLWLDLVDMDWLEQQMGTAKSTEQVTSSDEN
ncbi:EscU/YscU/HrcU family type III secretion system export apparatus switch protein [Pantoea sp. Mb-10]|uniref:EscU/YscU/HrcU family type III secretion system export apparatus switch protein n=1 Tax=unclassified Pantoea TaxID=2630326 RepID=UPI001E5D16DE|nr:EscU/YscU/HrcU family type III secretion system export apparatus switch protein [Pantoea sp. Mb-10]MCE0503613.1 EscU/YscU/HrcU family type III secretion system export apparatus switch protein [Pantoea sp. Pb-8]